MPLSFSTSWSAATRCLRHFHLGLPLMRTSGQRLRHCHDTSSVLRRRPDCREHHAPADIDNVVSGANRASSSCSATITVLPRLRRRISVPSRRSLSRWCRPIAGSSSTYITPTRPAPIWFARNTLGLTTGGVFLLKRDSVSKLRPTLTRNFRRSPISLGYLAIRPPTRSKLQDC